MGPQSEPIGIPPKIGRYRVVRSIGEGGMGVVLEAVQESPKRRVAIKVLSAQVASPAALRRFKHEAEVLGQMDHPGIAQIFEAGTFDTGLGAQPFFAMEYIKGEPINIFCQRHDLGVRQRLYLIAKICEAIEYAHDLGVVHRDLKPANILVNQRGRTKILDFGVARVISGGTGTATLQTTTGQIIGTIPYMSPEQAAGDVGELDARSDVYSLGVMAYELLAGRLPYPVKDKLLPDAVRIIREAAPVPLGSIDKAFRGDVDTIIAKALEKDKKRRYESAALFARDIRNYLGDEPITARPASGIYRAGKFVRRHRVAAVASTVAALLVVATATLTVAVTRRVVTATAGIDAGGTPDSAVVHDTIAPTDPASNEPEHRELAEAIDAINSEDNEPIRPAPVVVQPREPQPRIEWQFYVTNILAAQASLGANEILSARARLDQAPADLRGWEWKYLYTQLDRSLSVLRGHTGAVWRIAFSPDGSRIASGSDDKTVRLWDASTGDALDVLGGHDGTVTSVAFSPDGSRVASGSFDKTVRLWDLAAGDDVTVLRGHEHRVYSVAFSPDGSQLLTGSADNTMGLWDLSDRKGHNRRDLKNWILCAVFSPDGSRIATASRDGTVLLTDASTGQDFAVLKGHDGIVWVVAFSPDGSQIASASADTTVRVWDTADGRPLTVLRGHAGEVVTVAFSPDGSRIAVGSSDKTVRLWDVSATTASKGRGDSP